MSIKLSALLVAGLLVALPAQAQVRTTGLDDVNAWSSNLLERGEASFSDRIWTSSNTGLLIELMQSLDVDAMTPAERMLLSRTLRSPSTAPRGEAGEALQVERLKLLNALGERQAVAMLGRQLEDLPDGVEPDAIIADNRLATGELEIVCAQMEADAAGKFWSELRIICALQADSMAEAELALELAAGEDGADPWVTETAIAIIGATEDRPEGRLGSGLQVALSELAGLEVNDEALETARPDLAAAFSTDQDQLLRQRLIAARTAALVDADEAGRLRRLYQALVEEDDFEAADEVEAAFALLAEDPLPEIRDSVMAQSGEARDLRARLEEDGLAEDGAIGETLEKEAEDETPLAERQAASIANALQAARDSDSPRYELTARLFYSDLKSFQPTEVSAEQALTFARASLAAGNEALALHWLEDARRGHADAVMAESDLLRGYAILLSGERDRGSIEDVAEALLDQDAGPDVSEAALRLFSLWAGFDLFLPVEVRKALYEATPTGRAGSPAALVGLEAASRSGAHGEAILAALAQTGGEPSELSPVALQTIFSTLRRLGAEDEARALALETGDLW